MSRKLDLVGQKFGRLEVLSYEGVNRKHDTIWKCKCDCGKEHIVVGWRLKNGNIKSCGCYKDECVSRRMKKHGKSNTKLYKIYATIKQRCYNPNARAYRWYGKKGIQMCKEWYDDFSKFEAWAMRNGYKEGLSIDRLDSNKDYMPSNCEWVTLSENAKRMNEKKRYLK